MGTTAFLGKPSALLGTAPPAPAPAPVSTPAPAPKPAAPAPEAAKKGSGKQWDERAQKRTDSLLKEYLIAADLPDALLNAKEIGTDVSGDVALGFVGFTTREALNSIKEKERAATWKLLGYLEDKQALQGGSLEAGLVTLAQELEDLCMDAPNAAKYLGDGLALLIGSKAVKGVKPLLVRLCGEVKDEFARVELVARTLKGLAGQEAQLGMPLKAFLDQQLLRPMELALGDGSGPGEAQIKDLFGKALAKEQLPPSLLA